MWALKLLILQFEKLEDSFQGYFVFKSSNLLPSGALTPSVWQATLFPEVEYTPGKSGIYSEAAQNSLQK